MNFINSLIKKFSKETDEDIQFKRKEMLVMKDYDTAFHAMNRCNTKILQLKQWCIVIILAIITISYAQNEQELIIKCIPLATYLLFLILEIRVISAKKFDHDQVIFLEKIFMIRDEEEYRSKIMNYEFRSTYYEKNQKISDKIICFINSITVEFLLWHIFFIILCLWFLFREMLIP